MATDLSGLGDAGFGTTTLGDSGVHQRSKRQVDDVVDLVFELNCVAMNQERIRR